MREVDGIATTPDLRVSGQSRRRLFAALAVGSIGWSLPAAATPTLMQALIAVGNPTGKVAAFAVLGTVGALAATIATVAVGSCSDRVWGRFGRRVPFMVGGAVLSGASLVALGLTDSFGLHVVCFALFQGGVHTVIASLAVVTSDRVAGPSLGTASACGGVGYLVGSAAGGLFASAFLTSASVGLLALSWVLPVIAIGVAVVAPDAPAPRPSRRRTIVWTDLLPTRDRDLMLAFAGRFLTIFALTVIVVYQLFLLTDYLHVGTQRVGELIALGSVILGGTAAVFAVIGGRLSDRLGRRKPMVIGAGLLLAVGSVALLVSNSVAAFVVCVVLAGAGFGTYLSVDQALMVEVLPDPDFAARDLAFLTVANSAPVALSPLAAAGVITTVGYRGLFAVAIIGAVLGAACIVGIRRVE